MRVATGKQCLWAVSLKSSWRRRWPEIAEDASRITNGNLDVGFEANSRAFKGVGTFREQASDGLVGQVVFLEIFHEEIQDRAIPVPLQLVESA